HPITKLGLAQWPSPFAAVLIGYLMSSLVVTGVAAAGKRPSPSGDHRAGRLWVGCVGAWHGPGVVALYAALARWPGLFVVPLVLAYPLVTLAFAAVLLRSARVTMAHVIGVTTTVAGVMLLVGT